MKRSGYREQDYAFGQHMLSLRAALGLTQAGLAQALGVSRRAVGDWEAGAKYPSAAHLKQLVVLAVAQHAFAAGQEAAAIRTLWTAARQKQLLSEAWLAEVLSPPPVTAPPPAAEPLPTTPLPFQPTTFVGRSAEVAAIGRLLRDPACRLLTLHGPGGIGKTRLALAVAENMAAAFVDGIAYVALASVSAPNQIASAIGEALRLPVGGHSDPTAQLLSDLRARHLLLVLDTFEHLLDAAALVATLLAHAPHVKVVVTSRERLNLQAEWLFPVDGLGVPQPAQHPSVAQSLASLLQYSAVALFVERVRQVQPAMVLDAAALASIVQICHHVAGMPLALELAATSIRMVPLAEIEQQLGKNVNALATSLRDVAPRHRSMRAVFDHSWNLLDDDQRVLFRRLAVFRDGCTLEAAARVAGAPFAALSALADRSLVRSSSSEPHTITVPPSTPEPRFTMLEPIRGYALEQLIACGEETSVRQAHATYYVEVAEAAAAEWNTPAKEAAIARQGRELNNLRAALQWAYDTGDRTLGLRFALALWEFWRSYGHNSEGRAWFGQLLSLHENPIDVAAIGLHERALHAAAWLASDQHDYANATRLFEQSLALRRASGANSSETTFADLLRNMARQARAEGSYRQAAALLEELLARQRLAGDPTSAERANLELSPDELGQALREFGTVLREQGDFGRATALFEQALAVHHAIGDRASVAFARMGLGDIARDQGDSASVREHGAPSLATLRELGIQWAIGFALNNLAQAAYYDGDLPHASALIHESVALFRAISADTCLSEVLITHGTILWAQGDAAAAYDALTEALRLAQAVGPRLFVALALEGLANVVVARGDAALATRLLAGAAALRARMGSPIRPVDRATVEHVRAAARAALGDAAFTTTWDAAHAQSLAPLLSTIPQIAPFNAVRER